MLLQIHFVVLHFGTLFRISSGTYITQQVFLQKKIKTGCSLINKLTQKYDKEGHI